VAKKRIAANEGSYQGKNPDPGSSEVPNERTSAVLSRDDVIEIAAENSKLRRALDRITEAVSNEDLGAAADELEAAGYRVDFSDDDE